MTSSCENNIMNITGFGVEDYFSIKHAQYEIADEIVELRKEYKRLSEEYSRVFDSFKENDKLGNDIVLISKSLTDISIRLMKLQEEEKEKKLQYEKVTKHVDEKVEFYSNMLFGKKSAFECKIPTHDEVFPFKKPITKSSKIRNKVRPIIRKTQPILIASGPTIGLEEMIAKNQVIVEMEEMEEMEDKA